MLALTFGAVCIVFLLYLAWVMFGPIRQRRPHRTDLRAANTEIRRVVEGIKSGERGPLTEQENQEVVVKLFGGEIYDPKDEEASRRAMQRRFAEIVADRSVRK